MTKKNWIKSAIKKPGALRETLKIKKNQKIPESKLIKAIHSKDTKTRKRAILAKTLSKLRK